MFVRDREEKVEGGGEHGRERGRGKGGKEEGWEIFTFLVRIDYSTRFNPIKHLEMKPRYKKFNRHHTLKIF